MTVMQLKFSLPQCKTLYSIVVLFSYSVLLCFLFDFIYAVLKEVKKILYYYKNPTRITFCKQSELLKKVRRKTSRLLR